MELVFDADANGNSIVNGKFTAADYNERASDPREIWDGRPIIFDNEALTEPLAQVFAKVFTPFGMGCDYAHWEFKYGEHKLYAGPDDTFIINLKSRTAALTRHPQNAGTVGQDWETALIAF